MFTRRRKGLRRTQKRPKSGAHTAIIIEPRKSMQKALVFVVNNLLDNLTKWNIIIFPGTENKDDVKQFVSSLPMKRKSRVTVKDIGLATMDLKQYNALMMSRKILDEIPTEVFMVVQTDSLICKDGKHLLDRFIKAKYDYVGAPWKDRNALGNGGFSLRRKSMMLKILDKCPTLNHNEDGFFSGGCEGAQPKKPSPEEAEEFSVETIYNGKQPFGIHKAWHHMPHNSSQLEKKCLGYSTLQGLNTQTGGDKPIKAAVMAIFKNESMVMREWIEHYKWQGIDLIFLLNNDSDDDWKSITNDYQGFVTVEDMPGKHVQLTGYNEKGLPFLRNNGVDVVVTIDLDEYLFGKDGKNLKQHIQETFTKPDRPSAFTCGWSMFGSSGHKTQPKSIRESFTGRWTDKAEPENGISGKTITFLADIDNLSCIHLPEVKGRRDSCPAGLQFNHYPIMSEEYFRKVKMPRGDAFAAFNENARDMAYFARYDKNDVNDTILADLVKNIQKGGDAPLFKDAYAITMNPDSERYKQTEASAKAAGLTLHKWDAVKVDDNMGDSLMEQGIGSIIFKGPKMRFKGAIGCFLAHRGIMRHIAKEDKKAEGTLILEDDVTIPPDFNDRFQKVVKELPKDWDILYLDKVNPKANKVTEHVHKFEKQMTTANNWGNWAYIVRHKSLKKILALLEFMIDPVDIQLHKFADKLNIYLAVPSLIKLNEKTTMNSNINRINSHSNKGNA
jgi:GR25 family glycosyltransferase involved in LPS biosynthesis